MESLTAVKYSTNPRSNSLRASHSSTPVQFEEYKVAKVFEIRVAGNLKVCEIFNKIFKMKRNAEF